jgi:hypothetical protein
MIFVSYDFCLYHRGNFCPLFWRGSFLAGNACKLHKEDNNKNTNTNRNFRNNFDNNLKDNFENINVAGLKIQLVCLSDKFKT